MPCSVITLSLVIIISLCNKLFLLFQLLLQLFNDLYKNNANRAENTERRQNQNYFMEMMTVEGVYDYLMYVGKISVVTVKTRVIFLL